MGFLWDIIESIIDLIWFSDGRNDTKNTLGCLLTIVVLAGLVALGVYLFVL